MQMSGQTIQLIRREKAMNEEMSATVNRCMDAIREHVGTVELEVFIYYIRSQAFDYTEWQREHYNHMTPEKIRNLLENYSKNHEFVGNKAVVNLSPEHQTPPPLCSQ